MVGKVKLRRRVKRAAQAFCDAEGYDLEVFDMSGRKGSKHGRVIVWTGKHRVQVGVAGSSKVGIETTCRMVVSHLKNKILRLEIGLDPRSGN